jgi:hypothetical protein
MEAVVWGAVIITALKLNSERKPDRLARAKVCDALREQMSSNQFSWCLEYGAEETMGHWGYQLGKIDSNPTAMK